MRYLDVARDGTAVTEPKAITCQDAENGKERRFAFLHVPAERTRETDGGKRIRPG